MRLTFCLVSFFLICFPLTNNHDVPFDKKWYDYTSYKLSSIKAYYMIMNVKDDTYNIISDLNIIIFSFFIFWCCIIYLKHIDYLSISTSSLTLKRKYIIILHSNCSLHWFHIILVKECSQNIGNQKESDSYKYYIS